MCCRGARVGYVDIVPEILGVTELFGCLDPRLSCIRLCCRLVINEIDWSWGVVRDGRFGRGGNAGQVEDQLVLKERVVGRCDLGPRHILRWRVIVVAHTIPIVIMLEGDCLWIAIRIDVDRDREGLRLQDIAGEAKADKCEQRCKNSVHGASGSR